MLERLFQRAMKKWTFPQNSRAKMVKNKRKRSSIVPQKKRRLSIPILMQTYFTIAHKKSNECKPIVKNVQILQCKASIRKIVLADKTRKIVGFKRSFLQYES